jgi:hypothetical protein
VEIITHKYCVGNSLFSVVVEFLGVVDTVDNVDEKEVKICKNM